MKCALVSIVAGGTRQAYDLSFVICQKISMKLVRSTWKSTPKTGGNSLLASCNVCALLARQITVSLRATNLISFLRRTGARLGCFLNDVFAEMDPSPDQIDVLFILKASVVSTVR